MKRSPELRDLSEEHHYGLVAARHLRLAAEGRRPLPETIAEFLETWTAEIQPHFRAEEEILLPEFARSVATEDPLIVRALTEHVALRRAVRDLRDAPEDRRRDLAAEISHALDDHIRFEERVLFPAVEAALAGPALEALGRELKAAAAPHLCRARQP